MSAPFRAGHGTQQPAPATPRRSGWPDQTGRPRHAGIGGRDAVEARPGALDRQESSAPDRQGADSSGTADWTHRQPEASAPFRGVGTQDRHYRSADGTADAGGGADPWLRHTGLPIDGDPADADADADADDSARADIVLRGRGEGVAPEGLRFRDLPFGSLRQILDHAWNAQINLAHIPAFRAMNVAFFFVFTAPILTVLWFIAYWYFLHFHRAVFTWPGTVLVLHFLNDRVADWLVPDALDAWTWSLTEWACVAGVGFLFVVVTVAVLLVGPPLPKRPQ